MEITDKDVEIIKKLIYDWGFEYSLQTNRNDIYILGTKIGIDGKWLQEHILMQSNY